MSPPRVRSSLRASYSTAARAALSRGACLPAVYVCTVADDEARLTAELMRSRLEDFVAARTEAIRRARQQGNRDLAKRLQALRKPSVVLWALNQAGAVASSDLDELRDAGVRLRDAQEALLRGEQGAAERLQQATQDQRRQVDVLTRRLGMVLEASGHAASQETLRRVGEGLRSASTDDDTWDALHDGRLTEEPEQAGFPMMDVTLQRRATEQRAERDVLDHERRIDAAEAELRRAESVERTAREQEEQARQRREQATRALEEARARLTALQQKQA